MQNATNKLPSFLMQIDAVRIRRIEAGIIPSQTLSNKLWKINTGAVLQRFPVSKSSKCRSKILMPGAWFGIESMLFQGYGGEPGNMVALEDVLLTTVDIDELRLKGVATKSEFLLFFCNEVQVRLLESEFENKVSRFVKPELKVIGVISGLVRRISCCDYRKQSSLTITQDLIAEVSGVSRTIVSRALQMLAAQDFLAVGYKRLEIKKIDSWIQFAKHVDVGGVQILATDLYQAWRRCGQSFDDEDDVSHID